MRLEFAKEVVDSIREGYRQQLKSRASPLK
jgi:hypothetical protein